MQQFQNFISQASDFMWSSILMYMLVAVGIFYTLYLGFPQIRELPNAFRQITGKGSRDESTDDGTGAMSPFQALATAIASQIGTGNVAGVATAIMSGGPGAVFWIWVSAFLGMSTIFSEAILAQRYRVVKDDEFVGGPAYYITKGLKSKPLALFFSVAIIVALGFIGNMVQSNSIAVSVSSATGINPIIIGIVIAILSALVFAGGISRIGAFAEKIVPFMAGLYVLGSIVVMFLFKEQVLPAFESIFVGAFNPQALMGGALGITMKEAVRYGISRGLFSNEAGMGSTPHAHAVANVNHPVEQGMVAIIGVLVGTVLVCSSTAIIVLVTQANLVPNLAGPQVTQEAFKIAFGPIGEAFLALCLTFFAFTTIVGWYYFGESNVKYLFGKKGILPYRIVVIGFVVLGAALTGNVDFVWKLADFTNGLMVFPNVIALFLLAPQVKKLYKHFKTGARYEEGMKL